MEKPQLRVCENILETIGKTPLIKLSKVLSQQNITCQIYAKAEFMNPGGSIKDRIAFQMIEEAELKGAIKPGDTIVEFTSGNIGISLACVCSVKGYKLIITMPDTTPQERINTIRALGAEVLTAPKNPTTSLKLSYKQLAQKIAKDRKCYFLNQSESDINMNQQYQKITEEILEQMEDKIDYYFVASNNLDIVTGVETKLKEKNSNIKVIGVNIEGPLLSKNKLLSQKVKKQKVEEETKGEVPQIVDYSQTNQQVTVGDEESFSMARILIAQEGIFANATSGAVLAGAFKFLKSEKLNEISELRCVVIFPNNARNYASSLLDDNWMVGNSLMSDEHLKNNDHPLSQKTLKDLTWQKPLPYYDKRLTISDCFEIFKEGLPIIPIREDGEIIGVVTKDSLLQAITGKNLNSKSSCQHCLVKEYLWLPAETSLQVIQSLLCSVNGLILISRDEKGRISQIYVVGKNDVVDFMSIGMKEYI